MASEVQALDIEGQGSTVRELAAVSQRRRGGGLCVLAGTLAVVGLAVVALSYTDAFDKLRSTTKFVGAAGSLLPTPSRGGVADAVDRSGGAASAPLSMGMIPGSGNHRNHRSVNTFGRNVPMLDRQTNIGGWGRSDMFAKDNQQIVQGLLTGDTTDLDTATGALLCTKEPLTSEEEKSVEEVTKKWGLEAGLFSVFKRSKKEGGESSMQKAGDLLKKYGSAYLVTSISLATVSMGLCYVAVDNGLPVAEMISKVPGIEVTQTSKTAGTVGIAYAIHKAASPIRFPPTVALTPIVATKIFGRKVEDEDQPAEAEAAQPGGVEK